MKQVERLQVQLSEEKSRNRELSAQLTEAADYKARNFRQSYFLRYNQADRYASWCNAGSARGNFAAILRSMTTAPDGGRCSGKIVPYSLTANFVHILDGLSSRFFKFTTRSACISASDSTTCAFYARENATLIRLQYVCDTERISNALVIFTTSSSLLRERPLISR